MRRGETRSGAGKQALTPGGPTRRRAAHGQRDNERRPRGPPTSPPCRQDCNSQLHWHRARHVSNLHVHHAARLARRRAAHARRGYERRPRGPLTPPSSHHERDPHLHWLRVRHVHNPHVHTRRVVCGGERLMSSGGNERRPLTPPPCRQDLNPHLHWRRADVAAGAGQQRGQTADPHQSARQPGTAAGQQPSSRETHSSPSGSQAPPRVTSGVQSVIVAPSEASRRAPQSGRGGRQRSFESVGRPPL